MRLSLIIFCSIFALSGCSGDTAPPREPIVYTGEEPEIEGGKYAIYQTERIFNAPLAPLRLYIEDGNKIVAAMEETPEIKKPVNVTVLSGTWPEKGAVRRLKFSDGHYTLERVLENEFPTLFKYQVWNFTAPAGNNIEYAVGQQSWEVLADGQSKLTWTYKLKPNAGYKYVFVQRFVDKNMQPLMNKALDKVKTQADAHFADTDLP